MENGLFLPLMSSLGPRFVIQLVLYHVLTRETVKDKKITCNHLFNSTQTLCFFKHSLVMTQVILIDRGTCPCCVELFLLFEF